MQEKLQKLQVKFRKEVQAATETGLEKVRDLSKENVLLAAQIVNTNLKAVAGSEERMNELSSQEVKDYSAIAEKEHNKLRLIENKPTQIEENRSFSHTEADVSVLVREFEQSDILTGQARTVNVSDYLIEDDGGKQCGEDAKPSEASATHSGSPALACLDSPQAETGEPDPCGGDKDPAT